MPTLTRPRPSGSSPDLARRRGAAVAIAAAVVLVLAAATALSRLPVERATVDLAVTNPTPYDVHLSVRGGSDDGLLPLGVVDGENERRFDDVVDQGDAWVVRFRSAGVDGGEVRIDGEALRRDGYAIEVPPETARRFTAAGLPPSP